MTNIKHKPSETKRNDHMSSYDKITEELQKQDISPLYKNSESSSVELESRFVFISDEDKGTSIYDCLAGSR